MARADYDQTLGLVVIAATPTQARKLAFGTTLEEGPSAAKVWLHSKLTSCHRIGVTHRKEQVVLRDVHEG